MKYISLKAYSKLCGVSVQTVYNWIITGVIPVDVLVSTGTARGILSTYKPLGKLKNGRKKAEIQLEAVNNQLNNQ